MLNVYIIYNNIQCMDISINLLKMKFKTLIKL